MRPKDVPGTLLNMVILFYFSIKFALSLYLLLCYMYMYICIRFRFIIVHAFTSPTLFSPPARAYFSKNIMNLILKTLYVTQN